MRFFTTLVCIFSILSTGQSQELKPPKWRITPLPVVYYSPETRLGFGALLSANVTLGDTATTTTSYLQSSFIYTLNKQYEWSNIGRIYSKNNLNIFQYRLYHSYFPEYFHGIETQHPEQFKELIDYKRIWVELRGYRQIKNAFYAGLFARMNHLYNVNAPAEGSLATLRPAGHDGYTVFGFAPALAIDKRDSQVYPKKGHYLELLWITYPSGANDHTYGNVRIDARIYRPLNLLKDDVLAFHFLGNLNEGTPPFRDRADIGGSVMMRGYYTGYYRYKNLYALQGEYRFMVSRYLGFATWVGAALVADNWYRPFQNSLKPNAGVGLRVRINQKDKLNLRADYGFGHRQSGLYFDAAEAF